MSEAIVYKYKRCDSLRSDRKASEDFLRERPEILFDPSIFPVGFFQLKSLYIVKGYLRNAMFHFKDKELKEFR